MSEQKCGTCVHWQQPGEYVWGPSARLQQRIDEDFASGEKRAHAIEATYRVCQGIPFLLSESEFDPDPPLAFTQDGSEYKADLWTQAEFGCPLWSAIPDGESA